MKYRCPGCKDRTLSIAKVCVLDRDSIPCPACGNNVEIPWFWNRVRWALCGVLGSFLGLYGIFFMFLSFDRPFSWAFAIGALAIFGIVMLVLAVPLRLKKSPN